jgi:hypothetical protein
VLIPHQQAEHLDWVKIVQSDLAALKTSHSHLESLVEITVGTVTL